MACVEARQCTARYARQMAKRHRYHYGDDPSQWGELFLPEMPKGAAHRGVVVVIHGGYCRASMVSSTLISTVVSNELRAPPPLMARATAAMDTLSGASQRL